MLEVLQMKRYVLGFVVFIAGTALATLASNLLSGLVD
jgi:hypothetical protein